MRLGAGLSLAAAPTLAVMAAVTAALDARAGVTVCGPAPAPVSGMLVMYVLMSAFHLGPWLKRGSR